MANDRKSLSNRLEVVESAGETVAASKSILVVASTPHHAVKASGRLESALNPAAGKFVRFVRPGVYDVTYTFRAAVAANWDVKIEVSVEDTFANLFNAIARTAAPGVGDNQAGGKYMAPTKLDGGNGSLSVTGTIDILNDRVTFTAVTAGAAANAITLTSDACGTVYDIGTTFPAITGQDCTQAVAGDMVWDPVSNAIYVAGYDSIPDAEAGIWSVLSTTPI